MAVFNLKKAIEFEKCLQVTFLQQSYRFLWFCKHSVLTEKNASFYRFKWINQDIDKKLLEDNRDLEIVLVNITILVFF